MPRTLLKTLSSQIRGPRMLAILPVVVLTAFFLGGDVGLIVVAVGLPILTVLAGGRTEARFSSQTEISKTDANWREDLINWVEQALPLAARNGFQVAVVFITIDDLNTIEARFGRAMYENVLSEAKSRMKDLLRDDDEILQTGSGLAIGLSNVRVPENETLTILAQRLQQAFEDPFSDGPTRTYCSVSLGIAAESHVKTSSGANIVAGAQRASELALGSGPGAVRFYSGGLSSDEALSRNTARELNSALETNEIFAWFQPQVQIDGGNVIGFEALARWDHPEKGLIAPASFLPDIEKSGLSQRLAEVILKQSLMAMNVWDAAGYNVPTVSVNFSAEELKNSRLPDYVRWELDRHGITPDRLVIEVLESVASESSEDAITRTLHALSRLGCRIDLDDFGTGFTSFVNIRRFEVERIKIDRSLVNQLDFDKNQLRMFSALLAFGEKLGIETLAEGVETEGEINALRELGCRSMQGYAVSRPLPLGETMVWLESQGQFLIPKNTTGKRDTA